MAMYFVQRAPAQRSAGVAVSSKSVAPAPMVAPHDARAVELGRTLLGELQQTFKAHAVQPGLGADEVVGQSLRQLADMRARVAPEVDRRVVVGEAATPSPVSFGGVSVTNPAAPEAPISATRTGPRIALVANEIKCWTETSEVGADEIMLGGFCTDPFGRVTPLEPRMLDDDFEAGEALRYEQGMILASVPVSTTSPVWPAVYSMTLTLVEKDCEGADRQVAALWKGLRPHVAKRLESLVAGRTNAAAAVEVTTWVIGSFVNWMRDWSRDDVIGMQMVSFQLEGLDDAAYARAGLLSPRLFRLDFKGSGGHYTIDAYLTLLR